MATAILERERNTERDLRAYGKLSGREETREMTEEQKALNFNSRISENYKKLINPEFKRAEDFAEAPASEDVFAAAPSYAAPAAYAAPAVTRAPAFEAPAYSAPAYTEAAPAFEAPSYAAPAAEPSQEYAPAYTEQGYDEFREETADLMPTSTTIQYRSDLFENEKPTAVEEKKGYSLTAKGKLLMAVYALVVAVILALIIINTSVLKTLDSEVDAQEARLSEVASMSAQLDERIEEYTSDEYIINWAEENGFVHR